MLTAEKLGNIKREMKRNNLKMLGLTEVTWKETGDVSSDKYWLIRSGGQQSQPRVALVIDPTTGQSGSKVECTSDSLIESETEGNTNGHCGHCRQCTNNRL